MRPFILGLLFTASAFAQSAVFPGAVVTDSQLGIATNNVQTLLAANVSATATTFNVVTATGFAVNQIATIDQENVWICGVVGLTISVGRSSCPNVDGRGFDGSAAVAHSSAGANCNFGTSKGCVSEFVVAWLNNAKNKEIEAIEANLQPATSDLIFTTFAAACANAAMNHFTLLPVKTWLNVPTITCGAPVNFGYGGSVQPGSGQAVTYTVVSAPLVTICDIRAGGNCIVNTTDGVVHPEWFGNKTDTAVQAASNSIPNGGEVRFVSGSTYTFNAQVTPGGSYQTFNFEKGSVLVANTVAFSLGNTSAGGFPSAAVGLSSGTQGATTITLASSATFTAGQRIIVSGGPFTGVAPEEGPLEFNTVAASGTGTGIALMRPLAYNYSGFGLTGATPRVYLMPSNYLHDIRITGGGTWTPGASFGSAYFTLKYIENVEVDHIVFNGFGNVISTGGESQNFNFHDTLMIGTSTQTGTTQRQGFDLASLAYSRIVNNTFSFGSAGSATGNQSNGFICEVTCHDNLWQGNVFGPIVSVGGQGAISITIDGFNNKIIGNRIWGLAADVAASRDILGIASGGIATFGGEEVIGNSLYNIAGQCILDLGFFSSISGNTCANDSVSVGSIGITVSANSSSSAFGQNNIVNYTNRYAINTGGVPGTPSVSCTALVSGGGGCFLGSASDASGLLQINTGAGGITSNTLLATITTASPYAGMIECLLWPTGDNSNAQNLSPQPRTTWSTASSGVTTWPVTTGAALAGNSTYYWAYSCPAHQTALTQ